MSELKVYHHELRHNEYEEFYLKYEADKVIALLTDKANYNEYAYKLKSEELADTCRFYEDEISRQKYKQCLAMAKICEDKLGTVVKPGWWNKWHKRWLEIAEKIKEAK